MGEVQEDHTGEEVMLGWAIFGTYILIGIAVAAIVAKTSNLFGDEPVVVGVLVFVWPIGVIVWAFEVLGKSISDLVKRL